MLNYPLAPSPNTCNFVLTQAYDRELNKVKAVGAHNCKYYGVNLAVYFSTKDFEEKLSREFKVTDDDTGTVIF